MTRQARRIPSISAIVEYWKGASRPVFPDIRAEWIGWGEPFCFRCGWLAPTPPQSVGGNASLADPWKSSRTWFQRAHLHDCATGGTDEARNVVPLRLPCHHAMRPSFDSAWKAIEWVRSGQPVSVWRNWQDWTHIMWGGKRYQENPGWAEQWALYHDVIERHARTAGHVGCPGEWDNPLRLSERPEADRLKPAA